MLQWGKKLFWAATDSTALQIFRSLWVGGISFIADYAVLFLLKEICMLHYLIAAALAFGAGLAANFILTKLFVFQVVTQNKLYEYSIFALICLAGLFYTEVIMYALTDLLGIHYLYSKIAATVIVFSWNFFAKKLILYRGRKASE
ncbi:MAG: GtrA family protein [Lentisphaeria bacterium]|nr:GtrA family protein [Lentisphaeria bacterium]